MMETCWGLSRSDYAPGNEAIPTIHQTLTECIKLIEFEPDLSI